MKIVLCGPPHSGKSCLREGLKQALTEHAGAPYPYVITANPDGEGAWFQAAASLDREQAMQHKAVYKGLFIEDFGQCAADWVANCALPLVLVDLGGRTTEMNARISAGATHAILLAGDPAGFPEWRDFCRRTGLNIIAELHSNSQEADDVVPVEGLDGIRRGTVCGLKRGAPSGDRPTVRFVAEILTQMASLENIQDQALPGTGDLAVLPAEEPASYQVTLEPDAEGGPLLHIRFLGTYQNDLIVRDAKRRLDKLAATGLLQGSAVLRINGPASLPVMAVITHAVSHLYEAIAVYDPKLHRYVVSVSHSPSYQLGELLP